MSAVAVASDTSPAVASSSALPDSQQMVFDILIAAHRNKIEALTAGDIRERLEAVYSPRRFDKGWVTARLDDLSKRGAVERSEELRFNPLTKKSSHLWFVPLTQARLCA